MIVTGASGSVEKCTWVAVDRDRPYLKWQWLETFARPKPVDLLADTHPEPVLVIAENSLPLIEGDGRGQVQIKHGESEMKIKHCAYYKKSTRARYSTNPL